jgi:hypothetical protein
MERTGLSEVGFVSEAIPVDHGIPLVSRTIEVDNALKDEIVRLPVIVCIITPEAA